MFRLMLLAVLGGCFLWAPFMVMAETTITYQGQITHAGSPYNGLADLEFILFDDADDGIQIGPTVSVEGSLVSNGLVHVDLDFGPGVFDGQMRWLEVRVNGLALSPRQLIRAAPTALHALSTSESSPWTVSGSNIHFDSGGVGIGLDEPLAPLHVVGSGLFGSSANSIDGTNNFVVGGMDHAPNSASGSVNAVLGGQNNQALGQYGLVTGESNVATSLRNFVAGHGNTASGDSSFVAGGGSNTASGFRSFVAGNSNVSGGNYSFAAGRQAHALHSGSFVWSDSFTTAFQSTANNQFMINAHGGFAVVGEFATGEIPIEGSGSRMMWYPGKSAFRVGRISSTQWNDVNIGNHSIAMGQDVRATGDAGVALGRLTRADGTFSTAMGFSSEAIGDRSFVLGNFATAQAFNSVVIGRYNELAGLPGTWNTADPLLVAGNGSSTSDRSNALTLFKNGNMTIAGALTQNSDRDNKHDIHPVDADDVLERLKFLPLSTWRYNHSPDAVHIGPMAQDFYALFGFGQGDTGIAGIDANGVALAAIQGLMHQINEQADEIRTLRHELAQQQVRGEQFQMLMAKRLAALEGLLMGDVQIAAKP